MFCGRFPEEIDTGRLWDVACHRLYSWKLRWNLKWGLGRGDNLEIHRIPRLAFHQLKGYRPCRRPRQIGGGGQRVIHACLSLLICLAKRWCNATTNKRWGNHQDQGPKNARIQASSGSQFLVKGLCGACIRNRETPAGFKPKPAKTIPRKTPLTLRSDGLKKQKDDAMQPQTKDDATTKIKARRTRGFKPQAEANSSSKGSVGHACETGKPQQDSSPNLPKPSPVKLSNVAFWSETPAGFKPKPAKTIPRKSA